MLRRTALVLAGLVLLAWGCTSGSTPKGDEGARPPAPPPPPAGAKCAPGPMQSSPIAISGDDAVLVCVNQDQDSISIFDASSGAPKKTGEVAVGHEPRSIALTTDGRLAYVANTRDNTVSVVDVAAKKVVKTIPVGLEPHGVCLTPNATRLYVANGVSNTVSVIETKSDSVVATIDVSAYGTSPRAIGITNNKDAQDDDESVFVALFWAQLRPGHTWKDEGQDDQREGRVVRIPVATNKVDKCVALAPNDSNGTVHEKSNGSVIPFVKTKDGVGPAGVQPTNPPGHLVETGSYMNQLATVTISPVASFAYVLSTAVSPNGPLNRATQIFGEVSVIDLKTGEELRADQKPDAPVFQKAPLSLNEAIQFDVGLPRLFHGQPVALAWRPDSSDAWLVETGGNKVIRMTVDEAGVPTIHLPSEPTHHGSPAVCTRVDIEIVKAGFIEGKTPRGVVIDKKGEHAHVFNYVSRSITTIDIRKPKEPFVSATVQASGLPEPDTNEARLHLGRELFFTANGPRTPWTYPAGRMSNASYCACNTCHPDGLSDNVTWMLADGPRQTIPLDAMFGRKDPHDRRILNWSATRDEMGDFEAVPRTFFDGQGLIDDDRLLFVFGGARAKGGDQPAIQEFHQFDAVLKPPPSVSTRNELAGAPLPTLEGFTPRRDAAIATLPDARVFVFGGRSGEGAGTLVDAKDAVLVFDPRTNKVERRSAKGFTLRHSLGAATVRTAGGWRIYAIGGYAESPGATPCNTVEEYDPEKDSWRAVAPLPAALAEFGCCAAGGTHKAEPLELIHVVGGNAGSEAAPKVVASVLRFQADATQAGTWSDLTATTGLTARRKLGAAAVRRGAAWHVFAIGGYDAGGKVLADVESYVAQSGAKTTSELAKIGASGKHREGAPRAAFGCAASLTDNKIYIMGGVDVAGVATTTVHELVVGLNTPGLKATPGTPTGAWKVRGELAAAVVGVSVSTPPGVINTARNDGRDPRLDALTAFVQTKVRSFQAAVPASDAAATHGRELFSREGLVVEGFSCATCHGGPRWTRSTIDFTSPPSPALDLGLGNEEIVGTEFNQTKTQPATAKARVRNDVGTYVSFKNGRINEVRQNPADMSQRVDSLGAGGFNIPSLLSVHGTAPYFHNGLAQTLDEVLDGSRDDSGTGVRHHLVKDAKDRADLVQFLRSIDETTKTFP